MIKYFFPFFHNSRSRGFKGKYKSSHKLTNTNLNNLKFLYNDFLIYPNFSKNFKSKNPVFHPIQPFYYEK